MAKTKEELREIKKSINELSAVLQELSEDELNEVFGGSALGHCGSESFQFANGLGSQSEAFYGSFMNTLFKMGGESVVGRD